MSESEVQVFLTKYYEAQLLLKDPVAKKAFKKLNGTVPKADKFKADAENNIRQAVEFAEKINVSENSLNPEKKDGLVRIYVDGCFDLVHSGHYNAIRQAKALGDELVVGVNSDKDIMEVKGPTIMNEDERLEIIKHCKFVDTVKGNTPYEPSEDLLAELGCDFYAHGDDPCFNKDGIDICEYLRQKGKFKMFKRTEGVSTTSITAKLMTLAEELAKDTLEIKSCNSSPLKLSEKMANPPK